MARTRVPPEPYLGHTDQSLTHAAFLFLYFLPTSFNTDEFVYLYSHLHFWILFHLLPCSQDTSCISYLDACPCPTKS